MHMHICTQHDLHPYECNHDNTCMHCARERSNRHDPSTCVMCDPEYDFSPNPYWKGEVKKYDCETCQDTGEVTVDVFDNDSHTYQPTGTGRCPDCTGEDDADFSGATEGDR